MACASAWRSRSYHSSTWSTRASARQFVRLGLVLEMGSSYTLPRLIGRQRANELIYRAEPIDARTAESWGLVNRVFANDALLDETLRIAQDVAKGGPQSVAHCKRLLID